MSGQTSQPPTADVAVPADATRAGRTIDSLAFSREGGEIAGDVAVADLARVMDQLAAPVGTLHWVLRGEKRWDGKPGLALDVKGSLQLRCQRCLEAMEFPLQVASRLLLVAADEAWPYGTAEDVEPEMPEDDGWDAIEASNELALLPLIEDEVLLALPVAPRHRSCEPPRARSDEEEPSPFAVLAKLKKH